MRKAIAVMKKDLKELTKNFQVFGIMIILPIVFGLIYPLIVFILAPGIIAEAPEALIFLLNLFSGFFLVMAVIIPAVVAADSFAGEKERKTIEALLAAPISDKELFLGKVLVSLLPTILFTYLSVTLYCVIIDIGLINIGYPYLLPDFQMFIIILLVPLFALLGIELTVFISVRVKGFREAQQISGVIVLPVLMIVILNIFNISVFAFPWNVILFAGLGILDFGLYGLAVKKFGRENIISKI